MQLFSHITYIEMCTFVYRLVDPFNCNKSIGQPVDIKPGSHSVFLFYLGSNSPTVFDLWISLLLVLFN